MKIEVDKALCISAADCVAIAPNTFSLDAESKVEIKNPKGDPDDKILAAAKACPVAAIKLFDDSGKQIWPEV